MIMENCHCEHCEQIGQDIIRLSLTTEDVQQHLYELIYKVKRLINRRTLGICPKGDMPSIEGFNAMQTMEREFREDGQDTILERSKEAEANPPSDT